VQPLLGNSSAAGIGDDNQWTCNDPHILHRDANLARALTLPADAGRPSRLLRAASVHLHPAPGR